MKTLLLMLCLGVVMEGNKRPIKLYRTKDNCLGIVRVDTATLERDTLLVEGQ